MRKGPDAILPCRHQLDPDVVKRVRALLQGLPGAHPDEFERAGAAPSDVGVYYRSAIESIRGTFSATTEQKRRFCGGVFDEMKSQGHIVDWEPIGTTGRQDYRLRLPGNYMVGLEAKGCPDGNNMIIWERPAWAREFYIWSQCPDSLQHHPGHGVWSGVATRLLPNMVATGEHVDALIFFDGRCGSNLRPCPKSFGLECDLRARCTDIPGQEGREDWLPPPCVFLFPATVPHRKANRTPAIHTPDECRFVRAMLRTFGVPEDQHMECCHWARVTVEPEQDADYLRIACGSGPFDTPPNYEGRKKPLKRE